MMETLDDADWLPSPQLVVERFQSALHGCSKALASGLGLPHASLTALLENPDLTMKRAMRPRLPSALRFRSTPLEWQRLGSESVASFEHAGMELRLEHEVSQSIPLHSCNGLGSAYRIHRFRLNGSGSFDHHTALLGADVRSYGCRLNDALVGLALHREQAQSPRGAIHVSNVGGFHSQPDLFVHDMVEELFHLYNIKKHCVQSSVLADRAWADHASEHPVACVLDAWANVSRAGALNYLHHHADAAFAAVYYAQVPEALCCAQDGALLLRMTPGEEGESASLPDPIIHGLSMRRCTTTAPRAGEVRYCALAPEAGMLVLIPGWLPHAVAPHSADEPRVSYASNWAVS